VFVFRKPENLHYVVSDGNMHTMYVLCTAKGDPKGYPKEDPKGDPKSDPKEDPKGDPKGNLKMDPKSL
jgi:hypothetical protein